MGRREQAVVGGARFRERFAKIKELSSFDAAGKEVIRRRVQGQLKTSERQGLLKTLTFLRRWT